MKHIIAFAGSNSTESINKKLVEYTATLMEDENIKVTVLDLNDFEMPMYGVDIEKRDGFPDTAKLLVQHINNTDGIIIALAEHNGAYTSVFKNTFDWMSRVSQKTFAKKPMLLMATSPGGRGGESVLAIAKDRFPRHDAHLVADYSLPFFGTHFIDGKLIDESLNNELVMKVEMFKTEVNYGN